MSFILGFIIGLMMSWQIAKNYFFSDKSENSYNLKIGEVANPCLRCGSETICDGHGSKGAEFACLNPECLSWPEFSYRKKKEGFSTSEISNLWAKHKKQNYLKN